MLSKSGSMRPFVLPNVHRSPPRALPTTCGHLNARDTRPTHPISNHTGA